MHSTNTPAAQPSSMAQFKEHLIRLMEAQHGQADSDWVKLNVGGKLIVTTRTTLCKDSNSMLARMFDRYTGRDQH